MIFVPQFHGNLFHREHVHGGIIRLSLIVKYESRIKSLFFDEKNISENTSYVVFTRDSSYGRRY
jgi:hypothetical protein